VDSFPQILKPLALIGNVSPTGGFYALTNEILYDYQIGDEIQYHEYSYHQGGPPSWTYNRYRKYTILSKTVTSDSIIYSDLCDLFYADSIQPNSTTITLKYLRNTVIANIPFELFDGSTKSLYMSDYCGMKLWTYKITSANDLMFCKVDTCWGDYDTGGPPPQGGIIYAAGLGIYDYWNYVAAPPPGGYSEGSEIIYFKKNGTYCGDQAIVGINEMQNIRNSIAVYPNPANDYIKITSAVSMSNVSIFNPEGQLMLSQNLAATSANIDIKELPAGLYFAKFLMDDNRSVVKKIVVLKK